MNPSKYRCGVTIYDRKGECFRTCDAVARYILTVRGDQLFAFCHRHNDRIERAFPGVAK